MSNPNPDLHVRREEGNTADYVGYLSRGAVYGSYDVRSTAANFLGNLLKNYMKEAYKYSRTEFSHGPSSLTDRVLLWTEFSHGPSSPADRVHSYSTELGLA